MEALVASGRLLDLILALVALEALAVLGWCALRRDGLTAVGLIGNLASGAALILAVRAASTNAHWTILAGCLAAALVAHVVDLGFRFQAVRRGRSAAPFVDRPSEHRSRGLRSWQAADLE